MRDRAAGGGEGGMATVEAAIALAALVFVVVACVGAVLAVATQVRCVDAAREVARLAARGDDRAVDAGHDVLPGARIEVDAGPEVTAVVSADAPLLPMALTARAVAAREPGVGPVSGAGSG